MLQEQHKAPNKRRRTLDLFPRYWCTQTTTHQTHPQQSYTLLYATTSVQYNWENECSTRTRALRHTENSEPPSRTFPSVSKPPTRPESAYLALPGPNILPLPTIVPYLLC